MADNNNLKFRRQFLFSAKKCHQLEEWNLEIVNTRYLYVHPDCELNKIKTPETELYLIGFAINPYFPEKSSAQVLKDISKFNSVKEIPRLLYSLTGRFVLLIKLKDQYLFFPDACGLKQLFYTRYNNELFAASQPLLLNLVINLKKSPNYDVYFNSGYVKSNPEHYLPSGISLFEGVYQLVPNHYFDSATFAQHRFWPNKPREEISVKDSIEKISYLMKRTMAAANNRYKLAVTLTAGRDSRIILSSTKDIISHLLFYTLQYRNLTEHSNDIAIPQRLSKHFGLKHKLIDCRKEAKKEFAEIYKNNSDLSHWNDWGKIANGMFPEYPQNRMAVRGNCIEIGRCVYYKRGKHKKISSGKNFHVIYRGSDLEFIKKRISEWYNEVKNIDEQFGYDLYDLFYQEHRMGSWQAQSQLEWDIVQETFAPFNNREIIHTMLAVNPKFRCKPKYIFFNQLITKMWPETLAVEPINPESLLKQFKGFTKDLLIKYRIRFNPVYLKNRLKDYVTRIIQK